MADDDLTKWLQDAPQNSDDDEQSEGPPPWRPDGAAAAAEERRRRSSKRASVAVAAAAVTVGLAVLGQGLAAGPAPEAPPAAAAGQDVGGQDVSGVGVADEVVGDQGFHAASEVAAPVVSLPPDGVLLAAATVAVRLSLTASSGVDRYVDLAVAESVERVGATTAVVPVSVVLLEGRDGQWSSVRAVRYAVALGPGEGGAEPLGPPWPVAGPPSPVAAAQSVVQVAPVADAQQARLLAAALEASGYADVQVEGLLPGPPPPVARVRVSAVAPGEAASATHEVWIDLDRQRVLGAPGAP